MVSYCHVVVMVALIGWRKQYSHPSLKCERLRGLVGHLLGFPALLLPFVRRSALCLVAPF